jgi:hypothetical protein
MLKNLEIFFVIITLLLSVTSCQSSKVGQETGIFQGSYILEENQSGNNVKYLSGEIVYVPVYPTAFYSKDFKTYDLIATLNIRNTSLENSIRINKIEYYNTNGNLIKTYIENESIILKPLQTVQLIIQDDNKNSDKGSDVIVEWASESAVSSPIVEATMVSASGQVGLSFITTGKVIKQLNDQ